MNTEPMPMRAWCTFSLGGESFALDVERVREVLRANAVTRVPHAPAAVAGLFTLRGRLVCAVDVRPLLGLPGSPDDAARPHLVVRDGDETVSLIVDSIADVCHAPAGALGPCPGTLAPAIRALVRGVLTLESRLVLELDLDRVLEHAFTFPCAPAVAGHSANHSPGGAS